VRALFEEGVVTSYDSAIAALLEREQIDYSQRNVLLAHQFFVAGETAPTLCDSEQSSISVGGIDSVDVHHVARFDYVALGHIHGAQKMGAEQIRYSGTPLKYSVSEVSHQKAITMVTLGAKGEPPQIEALPLTPLREVRTLKGTLAEVLAQADNTIREDYVSITLTDEDGIYRPKEQLEEQYHRILEVRLDNQRIRQKLSGDVTVSESLQPFDAFQAFYQEMNGQPLSDAEAHVLQEVIAEAMEEVR
jgi:exonuclease SbcD